MPFQLVAEIDKVKEDEQMANKRTVLWNPVLDSNCSKYVPSILMSFDPVIMVPDLLIVIFLVVSGLLKLTASGSPKD
jgi:hypothetical protein